MEPIIAGIGSALVSILLAYLTAHYKTKTELEKDRAKLHLDVIMKQKYEYFLPFKYCADELRRRLIHIEKVLSKNEYDNDKYENMIKRLDQNFNSKKHDWFYNDEVGPTGGYFISSTIYQNCLLFYWMRRIQIEHPFIPINLGKKSIEARERYTKLSKEDKHLSPIEDETCDIYDFIKNIKIAISRNKGIPYGLQDSLGDFLFDYSNKRVLNYEEFCDQLRDERKRIKFLPVMNFWTGLVENGETVDMERLKKVSRLTAILSILNHAEIQEISK